MVLAHEKFSLREEILLLTNGVLWTPNAVEGVRSSTGVSLAWHWVFLFGTVGLGLRGADDLTRRWLARRARRESVGNLSAAAHSE